MTEWYYFDPESPEDRSERANVLDEIAAAEKTALAALDTIRAAADTSNGAQRTAAEALVHIATVASIKGNELHRRQAARSQRGIGMADNGYHDRDRQR